jgi:hypothetical protein
MKHRKELTSYRGYVELALDGVAHLHRSSAASTGACVGHIDGCINGNRLGATVFKTGGAKPLLLTASGGRDLS